MRECESRKSVKGRTASLESYNTHIKRETQRETERRKSIAPSHHRTIARGAVSAGVGWCVAEVRGLGGG